MIFSLAQLQALAASVGFPDPNLAAAVAMAESGGNSDAHGDLQYGGDGSIGLWQIFTVAHPQYSSAQLYDPTFNAKAAYATSSGGTNWKPWTTFRNGAYKRWYTPPAPPGMPLADLALAAAGLVAAAGLGYLAWREYQRPGELLPWRAYG
jgi:Lysozyme like domain